MNEKKRSGCTVAVIVIAAVGLVVLSIPIGLYWMFRDRAQQHQSTLEQRITAEKQALLAQDGTVTVDLSSANRYSPTDFGAGLSPAHFVALMVDQNATELTRQTFAKNATGQIVRWRLETNDVSGASQSGQLQATFQLPYRIQSQPNIWSSSVIMIRAVFPASELKPLANLRRRDWITIEGRLHLEGQEASLLDAKVVAESGER